MAEFVRSFVTSGSALIKRAAGDRFGRQLLLFLVSAFLISIASMADAAEEGELFDFNIPQQRADRALIMFAEQASLTLIVPFEEVALVEANGLVGTYTIGEGARRLLSGTGLEPQLRKHLVLAIKPASQPDAPIDSEGDEMKRPKKKLLMATTLASIVAATSVGAQDVEDSDGDTLEEVVVTGTRLTNRAFSGVAPVQVIDPEIGKLSGALQASDLIRSSSLATGSFQLNQQLGATSPGGSSGFGGAGVNGISLRGLGTQRSLVVLDGRRLAPAGIRGQVSAVDLNVLPSSVLERIEIVKDGSSSIYGADAIAGVVNGITKKRYDGGGIEVSGNIPLDSGGERYFVSGDFGKTFDRGWISISGEYSEQQPLRNNQRNFLSCSEELLFFPDTGERADLLGLDGEFKCRNHNPNGAIFSADWFGGTFEPDPTGALIGSPGDDTTRAFLPEWARIGNWWLDDTDAERQSYTPRTEDSVAYQNATAISPIKRYTLFLNGEFAVGDRTSLYGNVLLNRRESEFDSWMFLFQNMSADHPNNTVSAGMQAASSGNSTGAIQFQLVRPFNSSQEIDYYNAIVGLNGEFGDGWSWDTFVSIGRSDGNYSQDFMYEDRLNAISLGSTPCDASFLIPELSPASLCTGIDIPVLDTRFLVDQNWTEQEESFLLGRDAGTTTYDQRGFEASVSGSLFELPAGSVEGVFGLSYRKDEIDDRPGANTAAGNLHLFSSSRRTAGSESVKEAFAEFGIPLLADKPGARNVAAVASVRYTDYDISGDETTYKLGLNWQFTDAFALRGSVGTSFRGPNLFELFLADQTFFDFVGDPCEEYANSSNATVAANCASLGIPDDYMPIFNDVEVASGGAILPDGTTSIRPETSESWSVGLLLTPPNSGFAMAIEYFDIEVKDEIDSLGAQNIVNSCYSDPNFTTSSFCQLIERNDASAVDPFLLTLVNNRFLNIDSQTNKGFDFLVSYSRPIGSYDLLTALQGTLQEKDEVIRVIDGVRDVEDLLEDPNEPKFSGSADIILTKNDWIYFWGVNVFGSSGLTKEFEGDTFNFFNGHNGQLLREKLETGTFVYHNVSVTKQFDGGLNASFGVRNAFDKEPPNVSVDWRFDGLRTGTAAQNSWPLAGRRVFLTVTKEFD